MGIAIYFLIAIVVFLLIKIRNISNRAEKDQQEHQKSISQHQAKIDTLERERASLQKETDRFIVEISDLKDALAETERKLVFYRDIKKASGQLNAPNGSAHNSNTRLDPEQAAICKEMNLSDGNFFITGKAGTGKSFLLAAFKKVTRKKYIVLAPTGIAALNVDGATLHSTFGYYNLVHLGIDDISSDTIRLKSEKQMVLRHVSTIIIDEISMVRADTFDKIDRILKVINKTDKPFGGKQILLFGDLFQLPPIAQAREREYLYDRYGGIHFFCAQAYIQSNFNFRELTINHRQKEDAVYFDLLNRVRDGSVTAEDIKALNARIVQDYSVYDRFTTLLPTKAEVEQLNQYHICQLDSEEYRYRATIIKDDYPDKKHSLEALFPIADILCLKKGVLVMMVANDPERRWVNGSLGIVHELSNDRISVAINEYIYNIDPFEFSEQEVTYEEGKLIYKEILTVAQYPLVPAYAITIHKSQGQTYQNIICDINRCFAAGQAYVALSRCSSLNGLHLVHQVSRTSIRVDRSVLNFYRRSISQSTDSDPAE